ncbi:MAG: hypothetical protein NVSMB13_02000 [Mycobacteriales bacterium]
MGTSSTVLRRAGTAVTAAGLLVLAGAIPALAATSPGAKDPAGNNGTFKVEGAPYDHSDQRNEPHVSCSLELEFMNFDASQYADITFTGQSPTAGPVIGSYLHRQLSDGRPASGASRDHDKVFQFFGTPDPTPGVVHETPQLDPSMLGAPAKQGYHIKLDVTLASGESKHKVFWMTPCTTSPHVLGEQKTQEGLKSEESKTSEENSGGAARTEANKTETPTSGSGVLGTGQATTPTVTVPLSSSVLGEQLKSAPAGVGAGGLGSSTPSASGAGVLGSRISKATGASALGTSAGQTPGAAVLGERFSRIAALPFTGATSVVTMVLLGLGALLGGAILMVASRRHRSVDL